MAQFVKLLNAANYNIWKKHTIKFTDFLFFCGLISGKPACCSVSFHSLLITSYDVDILGFRVILSHRLQRSRHHNLEPKLYFRYLKEYFQLSGFWQQGQTIILD